jgi:hypothetical protein
MNPEPTVIKLPLSTLDNMQMELSWRFNELEELVKEIRAELELCIKETTEN